MLLSNLEISSEKHIIFAGDFYLFLDCFLDAKSGSPSLKKYSLRKLLEIKQKLYLCNIRRARNQKKIRYTTIYLSNLIQCRIYYPFVFYNFQEVVQNSEILGVMPALSCSSRHFNRLQKGSGL